MHCISATHLTNSKQVFIGILCSLMQVLVHNCSLFRGLERVQADLIFSLDLWMTSRFQDMNMGVSLVPPSYPMSKPTWSVTRYLLLCSRSNRGF